MSLRLRLPLLALFLVALVGLPSGGAGAVVPPKDCGRMTSDGKRYQVKVDQIKCSTGMRYTRSYLSRQSRPRGYRCRQYPQRTGRVRFYCNSGRKVFFAIRR